MLKKLKLCGISNSSVNSQLLKDSAIFFLSDLIKMFGAKTTDRRRTKWCIFHYLSRTGSAINRVCKSDFDLGDSYQIAVHRFLMLIICTKLFFKNFSAV